MSKYDKIEKLKKKHGGHGWICPGGGFEPCDSESRILHNHGEGLWGHELYAVNLLTEKYPKLLDELEKHVEALGYADFEETTGKDVVRSFMKQHGFTEL